MFKSGFVAIIGRPNVGKSTLINALVNVKVAIVSPKPQTTRRRIIGVKTTNNMQIIFVDTPGMSKPSDLLGKEMLKHAKESAIDADIIFFMCDGRFNPSPQDEEILKNICKNLSKEIPLILLLNKVDLIKNKQKLLPNISLYEKFWPFKEIIPISAIKRDNLQKLLEIIWENLPEGHPYFGPQDLTEQTMEFRVAETIREKVLYFVHQEIPYAVAVIVDEIRPGHTKGTKYIKATIFVEKESQKGILIGKEGQMLKKIGLSARKDIENHLSEKVFLELWVKVKKDWRERKDILSMLGYLSK